MKAIENVQFFLCAKNKFGKCLYLLRAQGDRIISVTETQIDYRLLLNNCLQYTLYLACNFAFSI